MASLVGVLRNDGGLCTGESYIPVVLFDYLVYRSPCFPDVDFTAFTGNPVNHAILFSRIDGVLRSHQMLPKCPFGVFRTVRMPCCSRQRGRGSDTPCTYGETAVDLNSATGSFLGAVFALVPRNQSTSSPDED